MTSGHLNDIGHPIAINVGECVDKANRGIHIVLNFCKHHRVALEAAEHLVRLGSLVDLDANRRRFPQPS